PVRGSAANLVPRTGLAHHPRQEAAWRDPDGDGPELLVRQRLPGLMSGGGFFRFIFHRAIKMVVMVFAIITANFLLVHAAPGDPASVMAGEAGAGDPPFM